MTSPVPTDVTPRAAKARVEWVDHAKGICIFFVVMLHVNEYVQEQLHAIGWLEHVVVFARPFRMPDFFLIAGLFLASALRRPWRHYLDRKVVHFLYLYGIWMTLEFLIVDLQFLIRTDVGAPEIVLGYFRRFIDPSGPLWFIHMLPIFFVVTRLTRAMPAWLMWLAAATLHSLQIKTGWNVPDEFAARYVYFYSGYVLAPHVFRIAAWAYERAGINYLYLAGWGIVNGLVVAAGWAGLPVVSLALGYAGALAVILTAVLLSKLEWTRPLRYLGQNSVVVYLGDFGMTLIVVTLLRPLIDDPGSLALIASVLTVVGTIVLWQLLIRTPARFLYDRPRRFHLAAEADRSAPAIAPRMTSEVPSHEDLTREPPVSERAVLRASGKLSTARIPDVQPESDDRSS